MGNSKSRMITFLIALIIGAAGGYFVGHRAGVEETKALALFGAVPVYVGPNAKNVNPADANISIQNRGVIYWKPWLQSEGHKVSITFKAVDFPSAAHGEPPFQGGTPNTDQTIQCGGGNCFSYDINPNLKPLFDQDRNLKLPYKYWQTLDNKTEDARIIINW